MANPEFSISTIDAISGLQLVEYDCGTDHRGDIYSTFHADSLSDLNLSFVQDKFSRSKKNVLRGFHGDEKSTKLVCCVFGAVLQVVYDARPESTTFGETYSRILSDQAYASLVVPPMVLNAYLVLTEHAVYHYKYAYAGEYFDTERQITMAWNDRSINFKWPINTPILSKRDQFNEPN